MSNVPAEDYTGTQIASNYQYVLHKGLDNKIYDGLGNEFDVGSASIDPITASLVRTYQTSSMVVLSSSYATTASYANFALTVLGGVDNSVSASYAETASVAYSASYAETASVAYSASSVAWNDVYGSPNFIESFETSSMVVLSSSYAARSTYFYTTITATGSYTASINNFVLCDTTSGSFSVLLPNSPNDSQIGIKKIKTPNSVTIYTEGVAEVDENDTPLIITGKSSATLICNSNNWYII